MRMGTKIKEALRIASKIGQQNPDAPDEKLFQLMEVEFDKDPALVRALCESAVLDYMHDEEGNLT